MNLRHVCLVISLGIFFPLQAQLVKSFPLVTPAQQSTLVLSENKTTPLPFVWNSGKATYPAGTSFEYTLYFDVPGGDFSAPLDNITKNCCASYFNDTVFNYTQGDWAGFLNPISQQLRGRDFLTGDTLDLKWRVLITAVAPGPVYEHAFSSNDLEVRFIRGQFIDEYVPVHLKTPADNYTVAITGNPAQSLTFSWTTAYCPGGCGAPISYELQIDTVDGDFSQAYYNVSVPGTDSSYDVGFLTLNQLLTDTKTPEQSTRMVFWRIMAIGNGQAAYSVKRGQLLLWNLSLNTENHPFKLVNPTNNTVILLKGSADIQLNFKWEETFTPVGTPEKYFLAFDTLGASPLFSNPILKFEVPGNGADTAVNLRYGDIDGALDSIYGSNWGKVNLMWAAIAQIKGSLYYPTATFGIELRSGFISSVEKPAGNLLSVYPNPSAGNFEVNMPAPGFALRVYASDGSLVFAGHTNDASCELNTRNWTNGLYFLHIKQAGKAYSARLLLNP